MAWKFLFLKRNNGAGCDLMFGNNLILMKIFQQLIPIGKVDLTVGFMVAYSENPYIVLVRFDLVQLILSFLINWTFPLIPTRMNIPVNPFRVGIRNN
jgi:hypothetical protein